MTFIRLRQLLSRSSAQKKGGRANRLRCLRLEELERRDLLSGVTPTYKLYDPNGLGPLVSANPVGFTPVQIRLVPRALGLLMPA